MFSRFLNDLRVKQFDTVANGPCLKKLEVYTPSLHSKQRGVLGHSLSELVSNKCVGYILFSLPVLCKIPYLLPLTLADVGSCTVVPICGLIQQIFFISISLQKHDSSLPLTSCRYVTWACTWSVYRKYYLAYYTMTLSCLKSWIF